MVPFKAGQSIKVVRTVYNVLHVATAPEGSGIGIALVDMVKVRDGSKWEARYSEDLNLFLAIVRKRENDGPIGLKVLFETRH